MRVILVVLLVPVIAAADAPSDVVATLETALAHVDPKTPIGESVLAGATAASTDVAADLEAVRAALVAKRYAILQRTDDSLTVGIKRARATIVLGPHGGSMGITPFPSGTVAPGTGAWQRAGLSTSTAMASRTPSCRSPARRPSVPSS